MAREELAVERALSGPAAANVGKSLHRLADILYDQGKWADAEARCREAVALFKQSAQDNPTRSDSAIDLGHTQWRLADVLTKTGRRDQAEGILREAVQVFEQAARDFPAELYLRQEQAYSRRLLGDTLNELGRVDEAERENRAAIALYAGLKAAAPTNAFYCQEEAYTTWMLAAMLEGAGRLDAAEAEYRHAIALHQEASADFPNEAVFTERLGSTEGAPGRTTLPTWETGRGQRLCIREIGERGSASDLNELAWFLATCGDPKSAGRNNAVVFAEKAVAATNRKQVGYLDTLAAAYAETGQFAKAISIQQEAIALSQSEQEKKDLASRLKLYENKSPYRDQGSLAELASARLREGKFAEAEGLARECLALREREIPRRLAHVQRPEHVGRQPAGTEEIRRSRTLAALGLRRDEAARSQHPPRRQSASERDSSAPGATLRSHAPARPSRRVEAKAGNVPRSREEVATKTETVQDSSKELNQVKVCRIRSQ